MRYFDLNLLPCCLDQFAKLDTGGTGCLARTATKTTINVLYEICGNFQTAFSDRLHLVNTTTRRIHLYTKYCIGWARRQTKTAVNALTHQIVCMGMAA